MSLHSASLPMCLIAASLVAGCPGHFVNVPSPAIARGTWHGTIEPVVLEVEEDGSRVTGIQLTVVDGPPLREQGRKDASPIPTSGWTAILVNEQQEVLTWTFPTPQPRTASVSGLWNSNNRYARWKGKPALQPAGPGPVRDLYNVIVASIVDAES